MVVKQSAGGRGVVVAPLPVALTILVTALFGAVGGRLLADADGASGISLGIAAWWVGLNVLVVGLISASAWRRGRPVVGGERVAPGATARAHRLSGRFHGVVLDPAEGGVARELHGFVSGRAVDAERLADRLNQLLQAAPQPLPGPEEQHPGAAGLVAPAEGDTVLLRRGLPLVAEAAAPEGVDDTSAAPPRHGRPDAGAVDPMPVAPRRARP